MSNGKKIPFDTFDEAGNTRLISKRQQRKLARDYKELKPKLDKLMKEKFDELIIFGEAEVTEIEFKELMNNKTPNAKNKKKS